MLDRVLTAATPWLEQRFDADLKEYGILKAQHGVLPSHGTRDDFYMAFFPGFTYQKFDHTQMSLKKEMYTIHIWVSPLLTRDENYSPQVIVKDIMSNHYASSWGRRKIQKVRPSCFVTQPGHWHLKTELRIKEEYSWLAG